MNTGNTEKAEKRAEKFSPGPWKFTQEDWYIWATRGLSDRGICRICDLSFKGESEANAALIAAAPELYDFVKMFTSISGQILLMGADNGAEIYQKAVDLVALANGETVE